MKFIGVQTCLKILNDDMVDVVTKFGGGAAYFLDIKTSFGSGCRARYFHDLVCRMPVNKFLLKISNLYNKLKMQVSLGF